MHANARTTPRSRADIVSLVLKEKQTLKAAAAAFSVCPKTARKWLARHRADGPAGLPDHSSRPHHSPRHTAPLRTQTARRLREQGLTHAEITQRTGLSEATLSWSLHGQRVSPPPPSSVCHERATPGELLHLDIKKLGRIERVGYRITAEWRDPVRGVGWECVYVCIDDHSRAACAQVLSDEKK